MREHLVKDNAVQLAARLHEAMVLQIDICGAGGMSSFETAVVVLQALQMHQATAIGIVTAAASTAEGRAELFDAAAAACAANLDRLRDGLLAVVDETQSAFAS